MSAFTAPHAPVLERALCILVVVLMVVAVLYAAWLGIRYYPDIRV